MRRVMVSFRVSRSICRRGGYVTSATSGIGSTPLDRRSRSSTLGWCWHIRLCTAHEGAPAPPARRGPSRRRYGSRECRARGSRRCWACAPSGNDEGRDPSVSHAELRPSGRQDLNLRSLGPENPPGVSDTVGSRPIATDVSTTTGGDGSGPSDTDPLHRLESAASGTIQAQRTLGAARLLTVREVAERLRVSRATVYRLVAEGRIPAMRVSSGAIRVPIVERHSSDR